ncbi:MAG: glycosyltransferase family 39 protein [Myxococcales bacterium]
MSAPEAQPQPAPAPAPVPEASPAPAASPSPGTGPASDPTLDRKDWLVLAGLLAVFALARVPLFPFAENLYGDSVVRSEFAERWANEPKVYTSFNDGVYQFGPLHFYYMGLLMKAWPSREHATRLGSLLMGLLLVLPVYRLGKRLFSRQAATVAALCMSVWSLHIQASTTAASEAVFLTLFFFALDHLFRGVDEQRFGPMALAALFTNLFCALRYDGWLYAALFALAIALSGKDRIASGTRALLFGILVSAFPLWWMQGNEKATGDALYPIHYIDQFHARWVSDGMGWLGSHWLYRLYVLFFWPGTLVVTASVLVGLLALVGIVHAFAKKARRQLALLALVPVAYYVFRGALLPTPNFSPLARFFMTQVALALFYVSDGFAWISAKWPSWAKKAFVGLTVSVAVATPIYLGAVTAWKDGPKADGLRPISPLSTIPTDQMKAARFIQEKTKGGAETVAIDEAPEYTDINVAFFSGLPEPRLMRRRWENFEKQLREQPKPTYLFAAKGGVFETKDGLSVGGEQLVWRGETWTRVLVASTKLFVYQRL